MSKPSFGRVMEAREKAVIVGLVLDGRPEEALEQLAQYYRVAVPGLRVGLPKGRKRRAVGCYVGKSKTIYVLDSDVLKNPYVILHEFYHHLRTSVDLRHRGTEKNADAFANEFIRAYRLMVGELSKEK